MTTKLLRLVAVACLFCTAGCLSKEVVVYKEGLLDKKAMKQFQGDYQVEQWLSDEAPKRVRVTEKEGKHYFSYTTPRRKYKLAFVVSKIPNSKMDLHVLSIPKLPETSSDHLFFIAQAKKGRTRLWIVYANTPVAKGRLEFGDGRAKAKDVKQFLAKHADEVVKANKPSVILRDPKA